jgi:hypothetical protein
MRLLQAPPDRLEVCYQGDCGCGHCPDKPAASRIGPRIANSRLHGDDSLFMGRWRPVR